MRHLNIATVLNDSILFNDLEDDFKTELVGLFEILHLKKSEIISSKDLLNWVYIIIDGRIKESRINRKTGQEYILYLHRSGDLLDIVSIVDNKLPEVVFECVNESMLLRVEMETFKNWLQKNINFAQNFLLYTVRKFEKIKNNASDLALYDTHTRLAKLILENIDELDPMEENKYKVTLINDLSNDVIASMIGSARAVVSRNIQELKLKKIIEVPSRKEKSVIGLESLKECCDKEILE